MIENQFQNIVRYRDSLQHKEDDDKRPKLYSLPRTYVLRERNVRQLVMYHPAHCDENDGVDKTGAAEDEERDICDGRWRVQEK